MYTALLLASGVFWSFAYLQIIARGFLDRTYGMPLAALAANISWEFIFAFLHPPFPVQHVVNIVWFGLDLLILWQLLRFGPREFSDLSREAFYGMVALALPTAFALVYLVSAELHDWLGAYAAFGQNLMMSILFIVMLYRRRSLRGQSVGVAVCKLVGTGFASLAFLLYSSLSRHSVLLPFLYISILVYDAVYLGMVLERRRAEQPAGKPSQPVAQPAATR